MQVIPYAQPTPQLSAPPREAGILFGCGVALLVFGAMVGVAGGFLSLSDIARQSATRRELSWAASTLLITIIASATLIACGIGSMRQRRWSRAVVLAGCGNLFGIGSLTLLVIAVLHATAPPAPFLSLQQVGSARLRASRSTAAIDDSYAIVPLSVALVVSCLAIPLFFCLIYRSRRVTVALEDADRRRSWVDGRPLPAISLAMALAGLAVAIFLAMFNMPPIPIGFASGDAAEARVILGGAMIVLAVFFAWSAWLIFRMHPLGPWLALLLIGLSAGGAVAAMTNDALRDSFGRSGVNYAPYEVTWQLQLASVRGVFVVAAYAIPAALYVLHVRRILRETLSPVRPE